MWQGFYASAIRNVLIRKGDTGEYANLFDILSNVSFVFAPFIGWWASNFGYVVPLGLSVLVMQATIVVMQYRKRSFATMLGKLAVSTLQLTPLVSAWEQWTGAEDPSLAMSPPIFIALTQYVQLAAEALPMSILQTKVLFQTSEPSFLAHYSILSSVVVAGFVLAQMSIDSEVDATSRCITSKGHLVSVVLLRAGQVFMGHPCVPTRVASQPIPPVLRVGDLEMSPGTLKCTFNVQNPHVQKSTRFHRQVRDISILTHTQDLKTSREYQQISESRVCNVPDHFGPSDPTQGH